MELRIGPIKALINKEKTAEFYRNAKRHGKENGVNYNFIGVLRDLGPEAGDFFRSMGIDPYGFQDLTVESINADCQMLVCSGYYPFSACNESELLYLLNERNERDEALDEIRTDSDFEIIFDTWNNSPALYFVKIVPWKLEPPLIKGRYENKDIIPEIDMRVC